MSVGGHISVRSSGSSKTPCLGSSCPQCCGAEPEALPADAVHPQCTRGTSATGLSTRGRRVGTAGRAGPAQPLLHPSPRGVSAAPCVKQELLQGRQRMMKPGRNLSWQRVGCWREPPGACAPPAPPPLPCLPIVPVGAAAPSGGLAPAWLPVAALASLTCPGSCMSTPQQAPGRSEDLARGWAETRQTRSVPARWCLGSHAGGGGEGGEVVVVPGLWPVTFSAPGHALCPGVGRSVDTQDGAVGAMVPG